MFLDLDSVITQNNILLLRKIRIVLVDFGEGFFPIEFYQVISTGDNSVPECVLNIIF